MVPSIANFFNSFNIRGFLKRLDDITDDQRNLTYDRKKNQSLLLVAGKKNIRENNSTDP